MDIISCTIGTNGSIYYYYQGKRISELTAHELDVPMGECMTVEQKKLSICKKVNKCDKSISTLKLNIIEHINTINQLQREKAELVDMVKKQLVYKDQLDQYLGEHKVPEISIDAYNECMRNYELTKKQLDLCQFNLAQLEEKFNQELSTISKYKNDIRDLENTLKSTNTLNAELVLINKDLNNSIAGFQNTSSKQLEDIRIKLEASNTSVQEKESIIRELTREVSESRNNAIKQLEDLSRRLETSDISVQDKDRINKQLAGEFREYRLKSDKQLEDLSKIVQASNISVQETDRIIKQIREEFDKYKTDTSVRMENRGDELMALRAQYDKFQTDTNERLRNKDETINEAVEQSKDRQKSYNAIVLQHEKFRDEVNTLMTEKETTINACTNSVKSHKDEYDVLSAKFETYKNDNSDVIKRCDEGIRSCKTNVEKIRLSAQRELQDLKTNLEQCNISKNECNASLASCEEKSRNLETALEQSTNMILSLKQENNSLKIISDQSLSTEQKVITLQQDLLQNKQECINKYDSLLSEYNNFKKKCNQSDASCKQYREVCEQTIKDNLLLLDRYKASESDLAEQLDKLKLNCDTKISQQVELVSINEKRIGELVRMSEQHLNDMKMYKQEDKSKEFLNTINILRSEVQQYKTNINLIQAEKKGIVTALNQSKASVKTCEEQLTDISGSLKSQKKQFLEEQATSETNFNKVTSELTSKCNTESSALRKQILSLSKDMDKCGNDYKILEQNTGMMNEGLVKKNGEYSKQIQILERENTQLQEALRTAQDKLKTFGKNEKVWGQKTEELTYQTNTFKRAEEDFNKQKDNFIILQDRQSKELDLLKSKIINQDQMIIDLADYKKINTDIKDKYDNVVKTSEATQKQVKYIKSKYTNSRKGEKECMIEKERLTQTLLINQSLSEKINAELAKCKKELQECIQNGEIVNREIEALKFAMTDSIKKKKDTDKLREDLLNLQRELNQINSEYTKLKDKYATLEEEKDKLLADKFNLNFK
jgi:chromosome segregation ATPase